MYIKNIVLDGFKSYASRTEINGFDPLFNAITGLNGSGKSNVLDSICFLLGISNLSHVRATNLQELIYKGGQAGVTKAVVTIEFDNTNKEQSPMGYESFDEITISRQIVLGGRNKYLINGSNANNSRVSDLFCSVQLNVNNPHFLIMQGRITKVLNMKPPEILSMIEEAAGTKMYDNKKRQALKTLEKKEMKITEMNSIVSEEITPTIKKFKDERSSYLEYQKTLREIEHLTRLCVAYEFWKAEETKRKSGEELTKVQGSVDELHAKMKNDEKEISNIDRDIADLQKNAEVGNILKELENKFDNLSKVEVKASSDVKHAKDALNSEKKNLKQLEKNITDNSSNIESKEKSIGKLEVTIKSLEESSKCDASSVLEAQNHFQAVSAGLSSNDGGEDKTLTDQLMDCKNAVSTADTEIKQANSRLKHEEGELKRKQAELNSTAKGYSTAKEAFDKLEKERSKLQDELNSLNYEEGLDERLLAARRELEIEVTKFQGQVDTFEARNSNLQFEYSDPEPNFQRSKIKGLVCKLIKIKDMKYATSLQIAAGAKLYNVIVDTEKTGKMLLEKGGLKKRVTIIPLNEIAANSIRNDVVNQAKSIAGEANVHTALSLVGYDNEVEAAMKFVFGRVFVANGMDAAKNVAFDKNVLTKTVTLDGDVVDPEGTLSGGARSQQASVLERLQELQEVQSNLTEKKNQLAKVKKELQGIKHVADRFNDLKLKLEHKTREVESVQGRLKQTTHHLKVEELKEHEVTIVNLKETLKNAKEVKEISSRKAKELEQKIKEKSLHRETELKNAEDLLKKAKKKAEASNKEFKSKQQELEELKLDVESLVAETTSLNDQVKKLQETMVPMEAEINKLSEIAAVKKEAMKEAEKKVKEQKETLRKCNEDIAKKSKEKGQLLKELSNGQLTLKKMELDIGKIKKESQDAINRVEHMLEKYEWIQSEQQYFGQANTAYDFTSSDPKESAKKLSRLQEAKEKLGANVNMRAMNMLGKAEEKYLELNKKRKIVEEDKAKLEEVIKELDEQKNVALKSAWLKVNKDFGSIFSTLLPGATAKLTPPEGQSILEGLEVKVGFGSVWKESLTELSGGQRSLVALSLILSMLLFKPAPIYILDEVDAALDLSHTQNVGQMLRQHFLHSQFIIVSLKDGMFNNANVLFKTKNVDGISSIGRFVQTKHGKGDGRQLADGKKGKEKHK